MSKWKVWYEGGATYSDKDGSVFDAPSSGVMCVAEEEPEVGRQLLVMKDYYWWNLEKDFWFGGDIFGLWEYLTTPGPKKVLFGRFVKNHEYQECVKAALIDPYLPMKSARHPEENFE